MRALNPARLPALIALPLSVFAIVVFRAEIAPAPADATPLYSAREGRTCDNCHLTPNTWVNPPLAERKCTMSCQGCHVDPTGGGPRTVSGRFFGRATLPMIATSPRPTADWDRNILNSLYRKDRATTYSDSLPTGPDTYADSFDDRFAPDDFWARGEAPLASPYRDFPGRYGDLNADPLLRMGWDMRLGGLISQGGFVFPMQADLQTVFHPVEHVTFMGNVGARGRTSSWSDTFGREGSPYLRQGFVMLHELPYLGYVKAGRFLPDFGLRLDDHTAATRRIFDQDGSLPETRVTGIEAGVNPNVPYARVSWFRSAARGRVPDAFDILDVDQGHGWTVNAGWRDVAWGAGVSYLARRRDTSAGGDENSWALHGSLSPWYYSKNLPLAWQGEFDYGDYRRESGLRTTRAAFYQELDWQVGNGVNLLAAQDWGDPDREVKDDEFVRVAGGVQITPVPGITLDWRLRGLLPAGGRSGADMFVQVHFWN